MTSGESKALTINGMLIKSPSSCLQAITKEVSPINYKISEHIDMFFCYAFTKNKSITATERKNVFLGKNLQSLNIYSI